MPSKTRWVHWPAARPPESAAATATAPAAVKRRGRPTGCRPRRAGLSERPQSRASGMLFRLAHRGPEQPACPAAIGRSSSMRARPRSQELRASDATPIEVTYSSRFTLFARHASMMLPAPAVSTSTKSRPLCCRGHRLGGEHVPAHHLDPISEQVRRPTRVSDQTPHPVPIGHHADTTRRSKNPVAPITRTERSSFICPHPFQQAVMTPCVVSKRI